MLIYEGPIDDEYYSDVICYAGLYCESMKRIQPPNMKTKSITHTDAATSPQHLSFHRRSQQGGLLGGAQDFFELVTKSYVFFQ